MRKYTFYQLLHATRRCIALSLIENDPLTGVKSDEP